MRNMKGYPVFILEITNKGIVLVVKRYIPI